MVLSVTVVKSATLMRLATYAVTSLCVAGMEASAKAWRGAAAPSSAPDGPGHLWPRLIWPHTLHLYADKPCSVIWTPRSMRSQRLRHIAAVRSIPEPAMDWVMRVHFFPKVCAETRVGCGEQGRMHLDGLRTRRPK